MSVLNTASVRVVDPILSSHAQGYRHAQRVGMHLFPRVPVIVSGGKTIEFGPEAFRLYNARRAPGAKTKRVQFGYEGKPYALEQDALEGKVPREWLRDAAAVPGIDLGQRAVNGTMNILTLSLEHQQAGIATNPANYDNNHKLALAGEAKWSDPKGQPITNVADAKEAIRKTTGSRPNCCVLSPSAWSAAQNNPQVLERFKFTKGGSVTLQQFAQAIEVEHVVVGDTVFVGDDGEFADVWGNNAVLAYAPQTPTGQEEPSFGYTYAMEGHPVVEQTYYDPSEKSWIYPVTYERAPVLTGMIAGFLIQNCK